MTLRKIFHSFYELFIIIPVFFHVCKLSKFLHYLMKFSSKFIAQVILFNFIIFHESNLINIADTCTIVLFISLVVQGERLSNIFQEMHLNVVTEKTIFDFITLSGYMTWPTFEIRKKKKQRNSIKEECNGKFFSMFVFITKCKFDAQVTQIVAFLSRLLNDAVVASGSLCRLQDWPEVFV